MPLEVCKLSRSSRSKICKENLYAYPDKGFCAAQGTNYYGYKLHAICSVNGVFQSFDLSPASVHDINYLKDIKMQIRDCTLIGDRGYLSATIQLNLFESCNITLDTPMRRNQKEFKKQPYVFRKKSKRIETLFSQLCDQFMIRRNYAKSFKGFKTRIISKITALTTVQYINKFLFDRNINNNKQSSGQAHEVFNGEKLILINENHPFSNFPHLPTRQASENSFRLKQALFKMHNGLSIIY